MAPKAAEGPTEGLQGVVLRQSGRDVVEPRRAERGGGDVRSGGDAAAADAANPLWAAVQKSGRDGVLPSKIAVWLRVRCVGRGASSRALMAWVV